ncbi:MAG: hypothetical protein AAF556_03015 [Pseudomonadota bacterium]
MKHQPMGGQESAADRDARQAAAFDEVMEGYGKGAPAIVAGEPSAPTARQFPSGPETLGPDASADDIKFATAMGSLPHGLPTGPSTSPRR